MDFTLSVEQQALQAAAREFARGEMVEVAEQIERDATPLSREWLKRYAEMGFLGVNVSAAHGGLGLGNVDAFLVLEEFAKVSSAVAFPIEASRLLVHRAAAGAEGGLPSILDSSIAKCVANEAAREVTSAGVQLMGGYGYSRDYPMERRMRDAWGWGIAGGTIDIQKVNIASALVGRRFDQRR